MALAPLDCHHPSNSFLLRFKHCASLKGLAARSSVTTVFVRRSDNDIHPNPHGHRIGSHKKEETVVCLHAERQSRSWRLSERGDGKKRTMNNLFKAYLTIEISVPKVFWFLLCVSYFGFSFNENQQRFNKNRCNFVHSLLHHKSESKEENSIKKIKKLSTRL